MISLDDLFDKPDPGDPANSDPLQPDSVLRECPAIHAYLTFPTRRGEPRELSTLVLGATKGQYFVRLVDPDNGRSVTVACDDMNRGILSLELNLLNPPVAWYYWPSKLRSKKK